MAQHSQNLDHQDWRPFQLAKKDQRNFLVQFAEMHGKVDVDNSENSLKDISDEEKEREERRKLILGLLGGQERKDTDLIAAAEDSLDDSSRDMPDPVVSMKYSELQFRCCDDIQSMIEVGESHAGKTCLRQKEVLQHSGLV
jgi:hypothetical protein